MSSYIFVYNVLIYHFAYSVVLVDTAATKHNLSNMGL